MKRKMVSFITAMVLALSLTACNQSAEVASEEQQVVEESSTEMVQESIIVEESPDSTEKTVASENSEKTVLEDIVKKERTYWWCLDGMEIEIRTVGAPTVEDSSIYFVVTDSVYDYKRYTEVKAYRRTGSIVWNKDVTPEMVDENNGGDGIFGLYGDQIGFDNSNNEEGNEENNNVKEGTWEIVLSYDGGEDYVTWKADGSVSVSRGGFERISEEIVSAEEVEKTERNYIWNLEGMSIAIVTVGEPEIVGSSIDFFVMDSIYDYKLYTEVKIYGKTSSCAYNKNETPEMVDKLYGGDGIFGFSGDRIGFISSEGDGDEENDVEEGTCKIVFSYDGGISTGEDVVIWNADGTISVSVGTLESTSF